MSPCTPRCRALIIAVCPLHFPYCGATTRSCCKENLTPGRAPPGVPSVRATKTDEYRARIAQPG